MEEKPVAPPRKVRFVPKIPARRPVTATTPKIEVKKEEEEAALTRDLLRRINEGSGRGRPKDEKKLAFGHGNSSRFIRSYGPTGCKAESLTPDDQNPQIKAKEYKEPWNYYTYYPVVHPLRRPYSGNPELLDAKEFGVASKETEAIKENVCDENLTKPAVDLGLMDEDGEDKLLFIHLPRSTPILKQSAVPEANEVADMKPPQDFRHSGKGLALDELPRGLKGKLLVYKSGLTKLKVGNTVYDVFPGSDCKLAQESDTVSQRSDCTFAQDLMAVNTGLKRCDVIGEVTKRAIMTPNVNSFLNSISLMD